MVRQTGRHQHSRSKNGLETLALFFFERRVNKLVRKEWVEQGKREIKCTRQQDKETTLKQVVPADERS